MSGAATARGDSSFGGGGQCDSMNFVFCGSPASSLRRSFASEGSRPATARGDSSFGGGGRALKADFQL